MKSFYFFLLFSAVCLLDGIILPSLFGFKSGVLVMVFIVALVLHHGITARVLWTGVALSLLLEFFWMLTPGSAMLIFLVLALMFFIVSSLLSIRRAVGASIAGIGLWLAFGYNNFTILITALPAFFILFLIFDRIESDNKKYV